MTFTNTKIKEFFKRLKRDDYVYLGIITLFFITLIIIFSIIMSFLSQNINKVFYSENNQDAGGLNIEQYTLVAKKLNITIPNESVEIATTPTTDTTSANSTTTVTTETTLPFDKQGITIKILNGTTKKGLATVLAKSMTSDGFIISKTGNEKSDYATTTLIIQENKIIYTEILMSAIRKSYPQAVSTTTSKANNADAVIIIGNN